jgi:hypothetical protein
MRDMAASLRVAAAIFIAAIVVADGSRPAASGTRVANATPDTRPNFVGKWEFNPWVTGEESEVDEITSSGDGMAIINRGVYLDQQGNRRKCAWVAPAAQSRDVLYVKPAPLSCDDGETAQSVACELRFISIDVIEAVCPPLPVTRYKRIR